MPPAARAVDRKFFNDKNRSKKEKNERKTYVTRRIVTTTPPRNCVLTKKKKNPRKPFFLFLLRTRGFSKFFCLKASPRALRKEQNPPSINTRNEKTKKRITLNSRRARTEERARVDVRDPLCAKYWRAG